MHIYIYRRHHSSTKIKFKNIRVMQIIEAPYINNVYVQYINNEYKVYKYLALVYGSRVFTCCVLLRCVETEDTDAT